MIQRSLMIAFAALAGSPALAAAPPAARGPSMDLAVEAAQTAVAACKANGYTVAASVVDSAGVLKVLIAGDGAFKGAVESSTKKATTTIAFKEATASVAEKAKTDAALADKLKADPGLFARAGAQPLLVGGELIGAIGVGGAPGGEKDDVCAMTAVEKIKARLK